MSVEGKRPDLLIRSVEPFNAGPAFKDMRQSRITPNDAFFVRNHGPVPSVDVAAYRLTVDGLVEQSLLLTLDALKELPAHNVTTTLQCAGNRRRELLALGPIPDELEWDHEAISTAEWRGVRLRDVLAGAGVQAGATDVAFVGLDPIEKSGKIIEFGGSISVEKALDPDTLLAYEMNGEPLPPTHGFPLRALIPGYIGARSVKWLSHIRLQDGPSDNYYQARAYKLFPSSTSPDDVNWSEGVMLGELPVNCVIWSPEDRQSISDAILTVKGYALAGAREPIRVDVSCDDGATWQVARWVDEPLRWTWRRWEARFEGLTPGEHTVIARAWDSAANTQPEQVSTIWNFKGYMNNAWHRIKVHIEG